MTQFGCERAERGVAERIVVPGPQKTHRDSVEQIADGGEAVSKFTDGSE